MNRCDGCAAAVWAQWPVVHCAICFIMICAAATSAGHPDRSATRADLGAAYIEIDRALLDRMRNPGLDDAQIASVNRAFDRASMQFFAGGFSAAIREIHAALATVVDDSADDPRLRSVVAEVQPPVWWPARTDVPALRLRSLYAVEGDTLDEVEGVLELIIENEVGDVVARCPLDGRDAEPGLEGGTVAISLPVDALVPGRYRTSVVDHRGQRSTGAVWHICAHAPIDARDALIERLGAVPTDDDAMLLAKQTCRQRLQLLTNRPSAARSVQFLADPNALIATLTREVEALEGRENPYHRRTGDYWRGNIGSPIDQRPAIPARIYAPPQASTDRAMPLVIALHGAGGDENMFMEAYGAGRIKHLADEHGMLIVSPIMYPLASDAAYVDDIIGLMQSLYTVHADRIYVVGHSMGAATAARLAGERPNRIAAVACLAGVGLVGGDSDSPPILVWAGALDPIVPVGRIEGGVDRLQRAGHSVTYRRAEPWGHTLIVGAILDDVFTWLLSHTNDRTPEADRE